VAESTRLVDLVHAEIAAFLDARAPLITGVASDLAPYLDYSRDLLSGGKRVRALFAYWGWRSVHGAPDALDPLPPSPNATELAPVITLAAALEFFHAAALVHDDIIDNSETRRGAPSAHVRFTALHTASEWAGDAAQFGRSAGILLGDLLLGFSDELVAAALSLLPSASAAAARAEFDRMRREVTLGQYLDILEESSWLRRDEAELLPRAQRVIVYKSAKYSIEAPLAIGGAMAGAGDEQLAALREFGLPLGIAYQLRDDMLGVFGDPAVTGKPAGDDLREGKRTVLVALARAGLPGNARHLLDELLGDPTLDPAQIEVLQGAIVDSGAVEKIERIIERQVGLALGALRGAPLAGEAVRELTSLADVVSSRVA
jgi:geranylgeranyl diphosphate synthase type I